MRQPLSFIHSFVTIRANVKLDSAKRMGILPDKPGKHTPYFELIEAQAMAGCPICRLVYKATDRYLDGLIYEAVLDPDVRAKTKRSRGFCAEHTEMLRRRPGRALGVALIYRDIIRYLAETAADAHFEPERPQPPRGLADRLRRAARAMLRPRLITTRLAAEQPCPACSIGDEAERQYLGLLLAHLDDDKLYRAYTEGEGLCLEHLLAAIAQAPDEAVYRRLADPQIARYRAMLADLDEFIRKRDHRFRMEKYGEEGDVWLRAMNAITGGAGMGLSARSGGRLAEDIVDKRR